MGVSISEHKQEIWKQCYFNLYQYMIQKDSDGLQELLDDSFVLVHMTGMQQDKKSFIHAIMNGTLNYYSASHKNIMIDEKANILIGQSYVDAAVFGGGKNIWRLQLQIQMVCRSGKWLIGKSMASTY